MKISNNKKIFQKLNIFAFNQHQCQEVFMSFYEKKNCFIKYNHKKKTDVN